MPQIKWESLGSFPNIVGRDVHEPWLVAVPIVDVYEYVRLRVSGRWRIPASADKVCEPYGYTDAAPVGTAIVADFPTGALIGRFGGGSAGYSKEKATDLEKGGPFAIGTECIVPVPADCVGPLFVGFNSTTRPVFVLSLSMTIEGGKPTTSK
jgi:hypothetical protein